MKTPDYLSYEKYKKKKDSNPNKRLFIFITTFFATLLLFSITAKSFSPDVDVTIGDESQVEPKETGLGVKRFIDDRLKMIQMDDNSAGVSLKDRKKVADSEAQEVGRSIEEELQVADEKMSLPSAKDKMAKKVIEDDDVMPIYNTPPRPSKRDLATPFEGGSKVSKVYVGRYSTMEQAKVAQEILMDSGINVSPFVKEVSGSYTLQIGSYSNRAKADEMASELRRNSFPARVVSE